MKAKSIWLLRLDVDPVLRREVKEGEQILWSRGSESIAFGYFAPCSWPKTAISFSAALRLGAFMIFWRAALAIGCSHFGSW